MKRRFTAVAIAVAMAVPAAVVAQDSATKQFAGQRFTYKDSCVERDPHVGHDASATQAARKSVKDFVATVFKLD